MPKTPRTITLDPGVDQLLDQTGNASAYVSRLVEERWREWREGLATMRAAGWESAEIKAACDACNGLLLLGAAPLGEQIALELHDAQRLNDICAKWELDPRQWARRVKQIAEDEGIARALVTQVRECWSGNEAWDRALAKGA